MYKEKLAKLSSEEEYLSLMYKKKIEEYDRGKSMLRTLVTPELYRILDEYIEVIKMNFSIKSRSGNSLFKIDLSF